MWLDSDLTFKTHVENVCNGHDELTKNQKYNEISYYRILCQISGKLLHVTPRLLEFHPYGLPGCTINQMQHIQNYGAKLDLGKTKYDSSTAVLAELYWLPVRL